MDISTVSGYLVAIGIALLALASCPSCASAQATAGSNVIILLRLAGDSGALPYLRSCLTSRLSAMPDTEVATAPSDGVRFIVDIIATKRAVEDVFASLVVAETFPLEQFRPRIKEGEDGDALLTNIRYYTLLRLHEFVLSRSQRALCARIAAEISDQVLSKEYTERND
jgi:hypothetical protein